MLHAITNTKPFDKVIADLEGRLDAARQVRELLVKYPELVEDLREVLGGPIPAAPVVPPTVERRGPGRPPKSAQGARGTNYDRLVQFFVLNGNAWTSAPTLSQVLRIKRGTIGHLLWTSHPDKFDQDGVDGSIKKKVWRLKPEIFNQETSALRP